MVIGDFDFFEYRSSFYITEFFNDCGLDYTHDGSTRWSWTADVLEKLLANNVANDYSLPDDFMNVLRELMLKADAQQDDPERISALQSLNKPLSREGFEAYFGEDGFLQVKHTGTKIISTANNPHRRFTPDEIQKREKLSEYLNKCSEDELIENVLLPLFRQVGYHRISAAGHKDKSLEYGKDIWMKYVLPTQHVLYFGIQVKKGKLDAAGKTKRSNSNISEIYNQVLMMLGHEIFDPEMNKKALVDHAFIIAGGEITKQARNWLVGKLDASQRSQILFMDRDDILNLFISSSTLLPKNLDVTASDSLDIDDDLPF